jgi:pimeloyl-ACP methyl ester carboxylesterase
MNARTFRAFQQELDLLREQGKPFPVPLLLVYSRRDPMVPPAVGDQLARKIPSARLVRMAEASHFAHVDAVDRFVPIALDFFGSGR